MDDKDVVEKGTDDLVELGVVSEDTHGQIWGHTWDGAGSGRRFP